MQALELMRTKRLYTHKAVHNAPKRFLFIILLAGARSGPRLKSHLNDYIFISHYHDASDGFGNVEDSAQSTDEDSDSTSSIIKASYTKKTFLETAPLFSLKDIESLRNKAQEAVIAVEIRRYIHSVIVFLRMHRAVDDGVSAQATLHFDLLVKCLAPLHSLSFVTPSLVALAVKKIYPHRINVTTPEKERSMQYGSEIGLVASYLEGITPEMIIEDVLSMVEAPL
ncbi:MAG: hypothetical protein M4579_006355 [Chaenotheca gracillima]|nr:MAG: hypothetical protein M4579_006355 [Chaenotheca gracillima]